MWPTGNWYVFVVETLDSLSHTTTGEGQYRIPFCSPHVKPSTGELVVRWVTTGESSLLYVFDFALSPFFAKIALSVHLVCWFCVGCCCLY